MTFANQPVTKDDPLNEPKQAYHSYKKQQDLQQKNASFYQLQRLYDDIQVAYNIQDQAWSAKLAKRRPSASLSCFLALDQLFMF